MQQRMRLTAYEEHTAATSSELERLRHEKAVLRNGAHPPSEQDHELQAAYYFVSTGGAHKTMLCSRIEHNNNRMLVVEEHTHEHFFSHGNLLHGGIVGAASPWCRTSLWGLLMTHHGYRSSR
jgi:hypothetical protein